MLLRADPITSEKKFEPSKMDINRCNCRVLLIKVEALSSRYLLYYKYLPI